MRRGRDVLDLHLEMLDHHSLAKQDTVCYTACVAPPRNEHAVLCDGVTCALWWATRCGGCGLCCWCGLTLALGCDAVGVCWCVCCAARWRSHALVLLWCA